MKRRGSGRWSDDLIERGEGRSSYDPSTALGMTSGGEARLSARPPENGGRKRRADILECGGSPPLFTVDTVAPHELFERCGWHRKSGSKLPHSKETQEHRQECLCHQKEVSGHHTGRRTPRAQARMPVPPKAGEERPPHKEENPKSTGRNACATSHKSQDTRSSSGRGRLPSLGHPIVRQN